MKALLKKKQQLKKMNYGYNELISHFLSDDFIFNKKNTVEFFKNLYQLDATVRYDKLTIKTKKLKYAEGMFEAKQVNGKLTKSIFVNKELLTRFNNVKYAKPYTLSSFIHEMHHKKQFDNFWFNKICDIKEENEINKYMFYENLIDTYNPQFSLINPASLREITARMNTLEDYVKLIKEGVIEPTLENLVSILPSTLQAYSMRYSVYDNNILLQYKNDAEFDVNYFHDYYLRKYNDFKDILEYIPLPPNKKEEVQNINFDKFFFELREKGKQFDDNVCFIYNQLLSNYRVPMKYKEFATNLQVISKHYKEKFIKNNNTEQDEEYIIIP